MTGSPSPYKDFVCTEDGLKFKIATFMGDDGQVYAKIMVLQGSADFNALYWGDDQDDGDSFGFDESQLNMNGSKTDWDGGTHISNPGLGPEGEDKDSYLTEGEYMVVKLEGATSLDDVSTIGIRATSTSTPEGSIKCVVEEYDGQDDEHHEDDPEDKHLHDKHQEVVDQHEEDPAAFFAQFFSPMEGEDDPPPPEDDEEVNFEDMAFI